MSLRAKRSKQKPKYKDSDDSESAKDFEDSGSEASIPDATGTENSSDGSDGEFEGAEEETITKKKKMSKKTKKCTEKPLKSRISMDTIKRNLKSAGLRNDSSQDQNSLEEEMISVKDLTEQEKLLPAVLNLSESDSDSDGDNEPKKRSSTYSDQPLDYGSFIVNENVAGPSKRKTTTDKAKKLSDSSSDSEMEDVGDSEITNMASQRKSPERNPPATKLNFQHLQEHTKRMEEAKQSLEQYKKRVSNVTSKQNDLKIHELLAIGESEIFEEKEEVSEEQDSDSDVEDLEEVKGEAKSQATIPKGGIQLVLNLPTDGPKQKKKQLDIEMMMKRRINRVKKEYQVYIHRVHVLCWLGHGNYVNAALNDQSIMAAALSLIPSEQCYPENRVNIKYIEQITKWYITRVILKEDKNEHKYKPNKKSIMLALLQQIEKKTAVSKKNLVLIFIAMLRALGIKCRLVLSFRVAPLRPPELISLSVKNKEDPKSDKSKDAGKTSKHFDSSQSKSKTSKDSKTKPTKENAIQKSSSRSSESKRKEGAYEKISQLDGADDRITKQVPTSSGSQKKKNISLKNVPAKKPKLEPPSPKSPSSSNTSYWDQLIQNVEDTPKNPKRISHRELKMEHSPLYSPPKIKTESNSPIKKTIFDESTLIAGKNKMDIFADSTVSLNGSSNSTDKGGTTSFTGVLNKSPTITPRKETNVNDSDKNVSSSSEATVSKKKSLTLSSKAVEKDNRKSSRTKSSVDKNTSSNKGNEIDPDKTLAKTRPRRVSKNSAVSSTEKTVSKDDTVKTPSNSKASGKALTEKSKTDPVRPKTRSRRQSADQKPSTTQSSSSKTTSRKNIKEKIEKSKNETFTIHTDNEKNEETPSVKRKTNTNSKSSAAVEKKKVNEKDKKDGGEVKTAKKISEAVSKYFSPEKTPGTSKAPAKGSRVSHRDLMIKSLVAGISPQKDASKDSAASAKGKGRESKAQANSKLIKGEGCDIGQKAVPKTKPRRVSEMSDADFKPGKNKTSASKSSKDRRVLSSDEDCGVDIKRKGVDVWCEVYVEEEEQWISVDVVKAQVHCCNEIYTRSSHPVTYIVSWDNNSHVKDVTRRYVPHWNTTTRKLRTDPVWYEQALRSWIAPPSLENVIEDRLLDRMQLDAPLPKSIAEFKNHPLYALKRHLLKFEVIYPPDAPTLGFIRNEPVYARECVHICRSRETWVKEAKVVKPGEQPYKIVKARPKYDRLSGNLIRDIPLEIFGPWQVDEYVPPAAENGVVPRNPYGNVELFKACMLPKGTVHLQLPGLNKVAKKLGIDCAPAMTGFDYHSGWSHPVYDGFVVCEEFKEQIILAWEQEQEEAEARALEKVEKRVYGNWKRLIRGLLIREKLRAKYDFQDMPEDKLGGGKGKKRSKGPRFLAKKRRSCEGSSESDSS